MDFNEYYNECIKGKESVFPTEKDMCREIWEVATIEACGSIPSWILAAGDRIQAGEPEKEVMADYGYRYQDR